MEDAPPGQRIGVGGLVKGSVDSYRSGLYVARTAREHRLVTGYLHSGAGTTVDFTREAVVTIAAQSGCAKPQAAQLYADGDRLALRRDLDEEWQECYAPFSLLAEFVVPLDRLPAHPRLGDRPPNDIGVGILIAEDTERVDPSDPPIRVLPVTDRSSFRDWYRLGVHAGEKVRTEVPEGERRFAFLIPGCGGLIPRVDLAADGAPVASVKSFRTSASPPCDPREHYFVVYDLPAG
ncbi:hypothetical protein OG948_51825 (plasmid) [Embleya sp. NBC_00888]|uniref:hypothetical protein n=1 Tax=Embleya sp. NBC_00888 TaxID=2975960 RepID=UPI002F9172AE|nr:hypothetical protein OG948_51825 [Embleya sp. NBC_00888]